MRTAVGGILTALATSLGSGLSSPWRVLNLDFWFLFFALPPSPCHLPLRAHSESAPLGCPKRVPRRGGFQTPLPLGEAGEGAVGFRAGPGLIGGAGARRPQRQPTGWVCVGAKHPPRGVGDIHGAYGGCFARTIWR